MKSPRRKKLSCYTKAQQDRTTVEALVNGTKWSFCTNSVNTILHEYRCEPDHFLLTSITFGLIYLEKQYALEISTTKSSKKYVNDSLGSYETTGIGR